MLDLILAGGYLSFPLFLIPEEWVKNPRIQPWLERLIIGIVAFWCLDFLIVANQVMHEG